jgi:hypothetical protein
MTKAKIASGGLATVLVLLALAAGYRAFRQNVHHAAATAPAIRPSAAPAAARPLPAAETQGFLYGRVSTVDGAVYEGRLRWGEGEEAFWGDFFNGFKHKNRWLAYVPPERLPKERQPIEILGIESAHRERPINGGRPFIARFGEIARIESRNREVQVTLKSGVVYNLDRFEASDFDDGVRVWDDKRGVADLDSLRIRTIELFPTAPLGAVPGRLRGTVRTRQGAFTGFVQWDREKCVGSDELEGRAADGERRLRFDTLRSIERGPGDGSRVTLLDGREIVLSGTSEVGHDNRGIYVDDRRYGRVLVSWDAFERLDLSPDAGSGPAYGDFPPGRPLMGSVTTRAGRRLAGRLVYDLDESETTDTLDASSRGVEYNLPLGLVASIVPAGREEGGTQRGTRLARVILQDGEELRLERTGDLGPKNAGLLVFAGDLRRPEYVPWSEVGRVELDRPPATHPPAGRR